MKIGASLQPLDVHSRRAFLREKRPISQIAYANDHATTAVVQP
jgi:hypothetical protein